MNSTTHSVISTNIARIAPAVATPLCRGAGNLDAATERRGYKIMRIGLNLVASIAFVAASSHSCLAKTAAANETKPRIEVCFVLDTTGSMGGLIEGAKQKIWSIANEMISTKPTPELKLGLIGYRDRGDEYVVKSFQLTDDIDSIYGHLRDFKAEGGGDEPESVNEALAEAIEKMPWSQDRKVLKIIFLVGDAPPHLDYADGPKYPELCRIAAKKDLIINTVQCGNIAETTPIWKEIAKLSEGSYAAIAQSGGVAVIATSVRPFCTYRLPRSIFGLPSADCVSSGIGASRVAGMPVALPITSLSKAATCTSCENPVWLVIGAGMLFSSG